MIHVTRVHPVHDLLRYPIIRINELYLLPTSGLQVLVGFVPCVFRLSPQATVTAAFILEAKLKSNESFNNESIPQTSKKLNIEYDRRSSEYGDYIRTEAI